MKECCGVECCEAQTDKLGRIYFCLVCGQFDTDKLSEHDKTEILNFARLLRDRHNAGKEVNEMAVYDGKEEIETRVFERPRHSKKHNRPCKERTRNQGFQKRNKVIRRRT